MKRKTVQLCLVILQITSVLGCSEPIPARTRPLPEAPAELSIEDGSLFSALRAASVTVLKDGQIAGAGAFVDPSGLVLTAAHVVNPDTARYQVVLPDGLTVVSAGVVARDLGHDLALLRVDGRAFPYLRLAADMPPAGASIFVVAAPSFYTDTLLPGRIARDRPSFTLLGSLDTYVASYLITADTPKGASGGCWVNRQGEIIGVQSAFIGDDQASLGLAFIAPVNAAQRLVTTGGDIPASTLGAELVALRSQSPGYIDRFPPNSRGAAIHRIKPGSPAEAAGLPREALITHLNDQPAHDLDPLLTMMRRYPPGTTIRVRLMLPDSHRQKTYNVTLDRVSW
ncbi:MAG: S1C family serine protease [Planctomycetota bacterium]